MNYGVLQAGLMRSPQSMLYYSAVIVPCAFPGIPQHSPVPLFPNTKSISKY